METPDFLSLESRIVSTLKSIYDPEIPVNIYDLGLIYKVEVNEGNKVEIEMTLTAPNCPMADDLLSEVREKVRAIDVVNDVYINLVFEPQWTKDMLSDEAKLELGLL
ncbi:MAG TPA: FeS assembly SUF system protein [Bacteroidales bacterium]|nr:MAG: FeS assembly SUF system protein [Bacteroidetes bacterium GWF2_33_38]OFY71633.1 MAG: FeS assembly SUF system protein [Bacteroidetes bacterium RIFOXYA12_FULL_33_9]OFY89704.1 MAG: FeS assembly SUF system protein [Bacteroidetes bacterium RIFOXYA2_FULL_33_7]HBF88073.1 FeS assembly SUF system protein [Bacteroidales bacterium]